MRAIVCAGLIACVATAAQAQTSRAKIEQCVASNADYECILTATIPDIRRDFYAKRKEVRSNIGAGPNLGLGDDLETTPALLYTISEYWGALEIRSRSGSRKEMYGLKRDVLRSFAEVGEAAAHAQIEARRFKSAMKASSLTSEQMMQVMQAHGEKMFEITEGAQEKYRRNVLRLYIEKMRAVCGKSNQSECREFALEVGSMPALIWIPSYDELTRNLHNAAVGELAAVATEIASVR